MFRYCGTMWQWDSNIYLATLLHDDEYVHFYRFGMDEPLSLHPSGGKVAVPNIMLQTPGHFDVYAFTEDSNGKRTRHKASFYVVERPCPPEYIYDPTPVITYPELVDLVNELREYEERAIPEGGEAGQLLKKASDDDFDVVWSSGGGGGTDDHRELTNRDAEDSHPIEAITDLQTALDDLETADSNLSTALATETTARQTADGVLQGAINDKYTKPQTGIPKTDLASAVQTSLGLADTALQEHQSLDGYATEDWVEAKDYLTDSDLSGYATETWVESKGYALETDLPTKVSDLTNDTGFITDDALDGYATESWVEGKGYALDSDIPTKTSDLTNDSGFLTDSDLNGYATESWVEAKGYLTEHQDISGKADKSTVDTHIADTVRHVTSAEKSTWNGKQDEISDLADIRDGAELGATAVQPSALESLQTAITQLQTKVMNLAKHAVYYGVCSDSGDERTVSVDSDFTLAQGVTVFVKFTAATVNGMTLNVNSTGAKAIKTAAGSGFQGAFCVANQHLQLVYDGTQWIMDDEVATVSRYGNVRLNDTHTSTSTTNAPTAKALKDVYDELSARITALGG